MDGEFRSIENKKHVHKVYLRKYPFHTKFVLTCDSVTSPLKHTHTIETFRVSITHHSIEYE